MITTVAEVRTERDRLIARGVESGGILALRGYSLLVTGLADDDEDWSVLTEGDGRCDHVRDADGRSVAGTFDFCLKWLAANGGLEDEIPVKQSDLLHVIDQLFENMAKPRKQVQHLPLGQYTLTLTGPMYTARHVDGDTVVIGTLRSCLTEIFK